MTEQEFLDLISTASASKVLKVLSQIPAGERRKHAAPAMRLFRKLDRFWSASGSSAETGVKDGEAVTVAVLATATGSELKKLAFFPRPGKLPLEEIIRKLRPDWLQSVVDHFVDVRVFYVADFRPLWQAGLCERPQSDAVILAYYSYWSGFSGLEEETLFAGDVWRFFEVEGGGEDSLANHDKYLNSDQESWARRLQRYSDEGRLDRQRLLDCSLDALERDFGQYRAGWYSRFHVLMAPDTGEMADRADRYLRLLASAVPPTVSFALKHVQALEKAGALDPARLLQALEPALQARAKGTVSAALKLLLSAAKRNPDLREDAASKAVLALISEDAGVQEKALDVISILGAVPVAAGLSDYIELVAPSVRGKIADLAGVSAQPAQPVELPAKSPTAQKVLPVTSMQDALGLFLSVLEEPRDPFEVERAIDGLSRFGAELRKDENALSPLRKRARQVGKSPGFSAIRYVLALTGQALAEDVAPKDLISSAQDTPAPLAELSLQAFHLARNAGVLKRIRCGHALPMLSVPSDTSGMVGGDDLVSGMVIYREAGVTPDPRDIALALMRLRPGSGTVAAFVPKTEEERAVAYTIGADVVVGRCPELWGAAWCARLPRQADERVARLFAAPTPDCGVPAQMDLVVSTERSACGEYKWIDVSVPVSPANTAASRALPALFGSVGRRHFDTTCNGHTFADIAWASLVRSADQESFFRGGLLNLDTWQKLSDNPTRAFLQPFFRPGLRVGPLGAGLLAGHMACEDKSVSSLAAEAAASLAAEGRLSSGDFSAALKQFLMSGALPTSRWTHALKAIAGFGSEQFAREVIVGLLDFEPEQTPHQIGGLLELCYELHLSTDAALENARARECLQVIPGGGKTVRLAKKLLATKIPARLAGQGAAATETEATGGRR